MMWSYYVPGHQLIVRIASNHFHLYAHKQKQQHTVDTTHVLGYTTVV